MIWWWSRYIGLVRFDAICSQKHLCAVASTGHEKMKIDLRWVCKLAFAISNIAIGSFRRHKQLHYPSISYGSCGPRLMPSATICWEPDLGEWTSNIGKPLYLVVIERYAENRTIKIWWVFLCVNSSAILLFVSIFEEIPSRWASLKLYVKLHLSRLTSSYEFYDYPFWVRFGQDHRSRVAT